jgi:hypothetical protein
VSYRIVTDPQVRDQLSALCVEVLPEVAEAFAMLELIPWNGAPYNQDKPDSPMRLLAFAKGHGLITYLVLDDQDRVDVLNVTWLG